MMLRTKCEVDRYSCPAGALPPIKIIFVSTYADDIDSVAHRARSLTVVHVGGRPRAIDLSQPIFRL
jgi:hypothetical protein